MQIIGCYELINQVSFQIASVAQDNLKKLNPLVNIVTETQSLSSKTDEYFAQFHVVCMSITDLDQLKRINKICRANNAKFFSGAVFGFHGYFFADLGQHEYAE